VWPLLAGPLSAADRLDLPARRSRAAHRRIENSDHVGKIVLTL